MDKFFRREWYYFIVISCHNIATGFVLSLPSVMTPVLTSNTTDVYATKSQASWFITCYGITGPIGFITLPTLMQVYGRRIANISMNLILVVGSMIIACSRDVTGLIIGRATHGLAFPGVFLSCVFVGEYTHPKRRGFYMAFKMGLKLLAELLCHGLGLRLHWRQIAWISIIPSILGVLGTFQWVESPAWLAFIGRYNDCANNFNLIRGRSQEANEELKELLSCQQILRKTRSGYGTSLRTAVEALRSKEFMYPLWISILLVLLIQLTGNNYIEPYIIEIMTKLTGQISKGYYFTMACDVLRITGVILICCVIKTYGRRTLLLGSISLACLLMGLTSLCDYLDSKSMLPFQWITPTFIVFYLFFCTIGFATSVLSKAEIFPLQFRGLGICMSGTLMSVVTAITFKLTGVMIQAIEVCGMLAVYLVMCVVLLVYLYFVLPETKDRTLQDIENEFLKINLNNDLGDVQMDKLVGPKYSNVS